jgi:hypothetical protein
MQLSSSSSEVDEVEEDDDSKEEEDAVLEPEEQVLCWVLTRSWHATTREEMVRRDIVA